MQDKKSRAHFATKLGVIATTVGSAVGLGNIWRFPFEAGENGGGAFLLIDLFFIFIIGIPVICAEFIIGRHTGSNVRGAFRRLGHARSWGWLGWLGLLAAIMILSFYSVVAGWTMGYIIQSLKDFGGASSVEALHGRFDAFASTDVRPLMWTLIFLLINYFIVARGVEKGIERMSNIMMPMLFVILAGFCINSLRMPGAREGLIFLFHPDFSRETPQVILSAMGQAFFSLSLGLGVLVTYSGYFSRKHRCCAQPASWRHLTPWWRYSPESSFFRRFSRSEWSRQPAPSSFLKFSLQSSVTCPQEWCGRHCSLSCCF